MSNTDVADLRALEQEIARTNIEAVAADHGKPDDMKRPEVVALMESTVTFIDALCERDELREEVAFLRQQLAASNDKCAQLETTNTELMTQRDYFSTAFDGLKETVEAAGRTLARGHAVIQQAYPERFRQRQAAAALPSDAPPAIVTDRSTVHGANITQIRAGRPFR